MINLKIMVTLPGFEPGIPPWKGGVLTAWPWGLIQLLICNGCGSRIWTYDLRVMSPTSYQTALSRVIGAEDRNRTDTVFYHRRILSPVRLPVPPPRHLAPRVGLEPTAYRLTAECSTIELPRNMLTKDPLIYEFNVFTRSASLQKPSF